MTRWDDADADDDVDAEQMIKSAYEQMMCRWADADSDAVTPRSNIMNYTRRSVPSSLGRSIILSFKGLSGVKYGDKLCARVEVVAHQVGQLLVRVRL